jgi:hypothetical protein
MHHFYFDMAKGLRQQLAPTDLAEVAEPPKYGNV